MSIMAGYSSASDRFFERFSIMSCSASRSMYVPTKEAKFRLGRYNRLLTQP
jgi:hypothetical protein